jgi:CheY-like chemotaxis protein
MGNTPHSANANLSSKLRVLTLSEDFLAIFSGIFIILSTNTKKTYSVVLVDDSEDDRFFLKKAIEQFPRFQLLHELCDGQEAVAYLTGKGEFSQRKKYPLPDLMLLDLKMPRMNGYEVLRWLGAQSFPALTVIVLSGSDLQEDVHTSLSLGAHGYWTKTAQPEKQRKIALEIEALLDGRAVSRAKTQSVKE